MDVVHMVEKAIMVVQSLDSNEITNNILCVGSPETLMSVGGFTLNH